MATSLLTSTISYIKRVCIRVFRSCKLWLEYDGGVFSAAVAFYAALSAFPAFLILNSVVRWTLAVFSVGNALDEPILDAIEAETSVQVRMAVEQTIASPNDLHEVNGIIGAIWLFFMSLLVFAQIDRGFKRLWVPEKDTKKSLFARALALLSNRTRAVVLLFALGLFAACIFVLRIGFDTVSHALNLPESISWLLNAFLHILVHVIFFATVFKSFTPMSVRFSEAIKSALVLAVCLELGRCLAAKFVIRDYSTLYGISGSFIVILLWIYYTSILVFYSAAYLRVLVNEREEIENKQ